MGRAAPNVNRDILFALSRGIYTYVKASKVRPDREDLGTAMCAA